jgi:hypothetical protein
MHSVHLLRECLEPAGFAVTFFFMPAQSCGHDTCSAQVTKDLPWIIAPHDRQAADIMTHHSRHRVMKNFIRKRDDQILGSGFERLCTKSP